MKFFITLLLVTALLCSCSSLVDLQRVDYYAQNGNVDNAYTEYLLKEDEIRSKQGDLVYNLDLGMLAYASGSYKQSSESLEKASRLIDSLYTVSISQSLGTYLFNENTKLYQGEDFESVYSNIFSSLSYLKVNNRVDAMVEIRASIEKQALLKTRYLEEVDQVNQYAITNGYGTMYPNQSSQFSSSALSYYIGMIIARSQNDYNTFAYCQNAIRQAYSTQSLIYPDYPEFFNSETFDYASGSARLNFVAFSGLGPRKVEVKEAMDLPGDWVGIIAYPELQRQRNLVSSVKVSLSSGQSFKLERLENLSDIAIDAFSNKVGLYIRKTIFRTLGRDVTANVFMKLSQEDELRSSALGSMFYLIGSMFKVGNLVSEQADVRSSHFFPSSAWAGGVTLKEGTYEVALGFYSNMGTLLYETKETIEVKPGKVNLVQALTYL